MSRTGTEPVGRWQRRGRSANDDDFQRRRWWLFARRVGLTAAAVGLVATLVWTFLDLKPAVPLVLAVVPGYDRPLGPLLLTAADRRELEALGSGRARLGRGTVRPFDLSAGLGDADRDQLRDAIVRQVGQVRGGGPGRSTALVYLTCVGAVDREGRACLVPPGLPVVEPAAVDQAWLRVTDLIAALASLAKRPANLVLILDACRPAHGEPLGILDGGFAAAVTADVQAAQARGIHVVLPAGPGETACGSPAEAASVFTAAFIDAVEGCADADRDGRVTLRELGDYLADEVGRRALLRHGRSQTPFVVSPSTETAREIGVSWRVRREPLSWAAAGAPAREDEWLSDQWRDASRLRPAAIATRPEAWAALEHLLLRAERLAADDSRATSAVRDDAETIAAQLGEPVVAGAALPGLRLMTLAGFEAAQLDPAWREALEAWPAAAGAGEPPPARDQAEWRTRQAAAWRAAVERIAVGTQVDRAAWRRWSDLLGSPPVGGDAAPWPFELQAARLVVHWGEQGAWQRDAGTIGRVITLVEDAVVAALPADARADPLVAKVWPRRDADRWRREAYDLTFVGDEPALATAGRRRTEAAEAYARGGAGGAEISAHWQLLDRIRAELPWLATWWKAQAGVAAERSSTGAGEVDWPGLVAAARGLERSLAVESPAGGAETAAVLREAAAEAERPFRALRAAYDTACERLADRSAENATTLAEVRAVLAVPLVVGPQRLRLVDRERELALVTATRSEDAGGGGRRSAVPTAASVAARAGWVRWPGGFVDPFVAAIVPDAPGVAEPQSAGDLARAYAAWGQRLREAVAMPRAGNEAAPLADLAAASRRLAVPRGGLSGAVAADGPATEQVRARWHERLVTAAEDAIDEFLSRDDRAEPEWFLAAAEACLTESDRLAAAGRTDPRAARVRARWQALERAGDRWGELVNNPDKIGGGDGQGSAPVISVLEVKAPVPAGEAAVWLSPGTPEEALWLRSAPEDGSATAAAHRVSLPVARPDAAGRPRAARWRVDEQSAAQLRPAGRGTLDATAWFRGHRIEAPLRLVTDGGGVPLVWKRREPNPPRITVAGRDKRTGHVTFIFDCSSSMKSDQMAKAKGALQAILESLAQTGSWEASIWFYGHRARLTSAKKPKQVGYSPLGRKQDAVDPDLDVEQIQPMSPVTRASIQSLEPVLRNLVGWGQTPLYLALCEALERDAKRVPSDAVWRVIVLTDGINFANAPNDTTDASVRGSLRAVNDARAASPVAVDVVALDLTPRPDERAEYEKLRALAKDANGQWRDASDLENLKRAFRDFLGLERWEVLDASGQPRGQAELGGLLATKLTPGGYVVRLEGRPATETQVALEGGEIIELFAAGRDRPLEHRRYDGGTEQGIRDKQQALEDPGDPLRRWFVAGHMPRREAGGRVRFPVSLQNDDERLFSPRPVEWWAEVRPRGVADARPFVFVDPDFEPSRPVPVIDLEVAGWPQESQEAAVLCWFSPRRIDPAAVVRLDSLEFGEQRPFQFPDTLPGVTLDVNLERIDEGRGRLTVVERHAEARDLPRLRLRVEPTCERAEHLVDEAAGAVRHVFEIALDRGRVPAATLLSLADRDALKEHCVGPLSEGGRLQPLVIPIPRRD